MAYAQKEELKAVRQALLAKIEDLYLKIYGRDPDGLITLEQIDPTALDELRRIGDFYRKGERIPANAIPGEFVTEDEMLPYVRGIVNDTVYARTIVDEIVTAREGEASLKDNLNDNYLQIADLLDEVNALEEQINLNVIDGYEDICTVANVISQINDSVEVEQIDGAKVDFTSLLPIGVTAMWAFATEPTGWLFLNGQEVAKATYAALYALVGDGEGVPVDPNNFVLPNWNGRVPVGLDSTDTDFDTLGETGGAKSVTLQQANLPNVSFNGTTSNVWQTDPLCTTPIKWDTTTVPPDGCLPLDTSASASVASGGTDTPFSIMNPYKVCNFIIKAR